LTNCFKLLSIYRLELLMISLTAREISINQEDIMLVKLRRIHG